jgi:hypothetical protein
MFTQRPIFNEASSLPLEVTLLTAHGAAAYLFLIVFGSMAWHIITGLKNEKNKITGLVLIFSIVLLSGTGLLLYYSSMPAIRWSANLLHIVIGAPFFFLYLLHKCNSK